MDIARRIARMRAQSPAPEPASEPVDSGDPRVVELKKRLDALVARQRADLREGRPRGGDRALPGDAIDTPYGDVHVVEQHLDPAHCHGRAPVAAALRASSTTLGQLTFGDDRDPISAAGALFVDTETTGLSQGAGTLPFLIGLAWFDGESLTLRQLLLQRPGDEAPMLQMVRERICKSSCIVTYNGKSFDWPLLRNRFVMNRVPVPELPPHIDLLHSARCVYKGRLERVRLVNVEDRVLGFLRVDDVEGHEIPELYWSYVRGGSPGALEPVIEHNANDIIALAALLGSLAERLEGRVRCREPIDELGLARLALRCGDEGRALDLAKAVADDGDGQPAIDASVLAARLSRRDHDDAQALVYLHRAIEHALNAGVAAPEARLALAKLYEHQLKDFVQALEHATLAQSVETHEVHARRIARLARRIERRARSCDASRGSSGRRGRRAAVMEPQGALDRDALELVQHQG